MSPKSLVLLTLVAVAQLAMATPPACLLTAVGGTVNPADISTICKDSSMPSSISSACSGDASAAMAAFADTCKSAGVTVSDISTSSATSAASKTGSMTASATGSAHETGTATAATSSEMASATSAAGGSDGGSSGSSTGSAASPTSTPANTSAGTSLQVRSVFAIAIAAGTILLAY